MQYQQATQTLNDFRQQMVALREEMRAVQAKIDPEEVQDYVFTNTEGEVRLSELFRDHQHLFVIHNMGTSCPYCTLWADGFNGVNDHLQDRAAFVLSSPDSPKKQAAFKAARGWKFPMVSHEGTSFAEDMGYKGDAGFQPGVSVFSKDGNRILRVSDTWFGPGDDFCTVWSLFDLIPEGPTAGHLNTSTRSLGRPPAIYLETRPGHQPASPGTRDNAQQRPRHRRGPFRPSGFSPRCYRESLGLPQAGRPSSASR